MEAQHGSLLLLPLCRSSCSIFLVASLAHLTQRKRVQLLEEGVQLSVLIAPEKNANSTCYPLRAAYSRIQIAGFSKSKPILGLLYPGFLDATGFRLPFLLVFMMKIQQKEDNEQEFVFIRETS